MNNSNYTLKKKDIIIHSSYNYTILYDFILKFSFNIKLTYIIVYNNITKIANPNFRNKKTR